MLFNCNNYKEKIGNLNVLCCLLIQCVIKLLKIDNLTFAFKVKNRLRLPLVDSIGLRSFFVLNIVCGQKRNNGVAGKSPLNYGNKTACNPSYS